MTDLKMVSMSEIRQESVKWLAKPYIAFGKITLVCGDGGMGKSSMLLSIATDVTNGKMFCESDLGAPAAVVYLNGEDNYADTIKPRLAQLGANCDLVHTIIEDDNSLTLADERIEAAVKRVDAKLLVIDPLQYLCSDMLSVNGIRPLMKHIGGIAERNGCAVVLITHFAKKGRSQYRALGSIDIYAAARSVLTVGKLPLDDDIRVMIQVKNNLAPLAKAQAFGFDENFGFTWLGDYDVTIEEVLSGKPKEESQFVKARRLLETELATRAVAAVEIMEKAEMQGISPKTLNRAKSALGVTSVKRSGQWFWELLVVVDYVEPDENQGGQVNALTILAN
jgi:archaellum biogenesis ATPase FlaH